MTGKIELIEDVEREIRSAAAGELQANTAGCAETGHQWRALRTNAAATVTYCRHCLKVNLNGSISWPVAPKGGA
jgi:hypothetical protein